MSSIERTVQVSYRHRVHFTRRVFDPVNVLLKEVLVNGGDKERHRALVVLDEALAQAQPELARQIEDYFTAHGDGLHLVCAAAGH